ncbi:MAG: putative L,D-transpeptidase ErfK/SrfK precursor [Syntrophus sp. PtaU1.Bin208]|nr:MAG: putative L,D-transpeptidase ErfK/SrfK precursor [Syntrophus sp. PtaU1.Bin208]
MYRILDPHALPNVFRLIALLTLILFFQGCAARRTLDVKKPPPLPSHPVEKIERNEFSIAKGEDIIGRLALVRLEKGDTLPDIARHFSLGINEISAANPGVDLWTPEAGERVVLPLSFILPDSPRRGIVINLAAMRLFQFKENGKSLTVSTYPVGIGSAEKPTPRGQMYISRKMFRPTWHVPASIADAHLKKGDPLPAIVPPGPDNPLGEYALYLNEPTYLIHGTNKPASIGLNATNGCIRLYPESVKKLYEDTPVNTPVNIVDQPYLIGQRNGVMYLEAHRPAGDSGAAGLKAIYTKLKNLEKQSSRKFDWRKVEDILSDSKGIPIPISETRQGRGKGNGAVKAVEVRHPAKLYGKPEIPELKMDAWYVLAADLSDRMDAERTAAIINHQGPPIPARVLPKGNRYRVIAGPFKDVNAAGNVVKRLKIDLEIEGLLIEPPRGS